MENNPTITNSRKKFNEHALDAMTPIGAYILGLYYSDGCVCKTTSNRHIVAIGMDDLDVIEFVRSFFSSENKISTYSRPNGKTSHRISFSSTHLFNTFTSLGCCSRKSHVLKPPIIDQALYPAFLLGLFDGDGCISRNSSINSWKASIGTGSKNIVEWLSNYARELNAAYSLEQRRTKNKDFFTISFTGISAKYFLDLLYSSVLIHPCKRKWLLYQQLVAEKFRRGPDFMSWELDYIHQMPDNRECASLINLDSRNYGWTRSWDSIRHKRKSIRAN